MPRRPPAVAVWGTFDVDNYGDHLFPRIARRELAARLPGVRVDAFSPVGSASHPTRLDAPDAPVAGLGHHTPARQAWFAERYDAVLVGGGELLHLDDVLLRHFYAVDPDELDRIRPSAWFLEGLGAEGESRCPVLWHGLGVPFGFDDERAARVRAAVAQRTWASVRDERSAARLRAAGVGPALDVDVVPDSGLLVDRLYERDELRRRRDRLRSAGCLPPAGQGAVVVQGCDLLVPSAPAIAAVLGPRLAEEDVAVVLLETGRCRQDAWFADTMVEALAAWGGRVHRVPGDVGVADIAAVLSDAAAVVSSSLHAAITAVAHRRPFVVLNLGDESKLVGFGARCGFEKHVVDDVADLDAALTLALTQPPEDEHVESLQAEVDAHFDHLARMIEASAARRRRPRWLRRRAA